MTVAQDRTLALKYFNALWHSIEKHIGVDPECKRWPEVIRSAIQNGLPSESDDNPKNNISEITGQQCDCYGCRTQRHPCSGQKADIDLKKLSNAIKKWDATHIDLDTGGILHLDLDTVFEAARAYLTTTR